MTKGSGYGVYSTRGGYGPYKKPIGGTLGSIGGLVGGLFGSKRAKAAATEKITAGVIDCRLPTELPHAKGFPTAVHDLDTPTQYVWWQREDPGLLAEVQALRAEVRETRRIIADKKLSAGVITSPIAS